MRQAYDYWQDQPGNYRPPTSTDTHNNSECLDLDHNNHSQQDEWRRFKGTITPKWLGISICASRTVCFHNDSPTGQPRSLLHYKKDRQLAPCGSIVTVLEPTSRNTDTQGHTSSIASKTLGKRAAATHNLTGKTRGFRHTNRTLRCVLPSIGNIKDHPQTEQLSRPEPGMRAGRYVHIGRHRPAIQTPLRSRSAAISGAIIRGSGSLQTRSVVTAASPRSNPCRRRGPLNLLAHAHRGYL